MAGSTRRNVHVYSSSDGTEVAGFFQHGGVSISTFIGWINKVTVCIVPGEWDLYPCKIGNDRASDGPALDRNSEDELQPGRYVMRTPAPESSQVVVYLTADVPRTRAYSCTYTPHETQFVTRIRERDGRCCITGQSVVGEDYTGFEAAHIFPLSETDVWNNLNYKRFIEDDQIVAGYEMNSIQQGFLCSSTEHRMFDDYSIAINPDDDYRIYDFVGRDPNRSPHGKFFYRNPNVQQRYLPCAELLRDHFRQCVLRHIKGAGEDNDTERHFDRDIDLRAGGFDLTTGGWWSSSVGKKQLEAELATRLWGVGAARSQVHDVEYIQHSCNGQRK